MAEIHVLQPNSLVRRATAPLVSTGAPGSSGDANVSSTEDGEPWIAIRDIPELHADLFPPRALPKLLATPAPFVTTNVQGDAEHKETDVFQLLRDNSARDRAAHDELMRDLGPRPNRRRRDYFIVAGGLNAFVVVAGAFIGYTNPFLLGLWTIGNVGLAWVLFLVMDRY